MDNSIEIQKILSSIPDEQSDAIKYQQMADLSTNPEDADILNKIAVDELSHKQLLENMAERDGVTVMDTAPEQTIADIIGDSNSDGSNVYSNTNIPEVEESSFPVSVPVHAVMENQPLEESTAAEHFGRAICMGKMHRTKPISEMTADERQCVLDTGLKWEKHLIERVEERTPATNINEEADLVGAHGKAIGQLKLVNGRVTMCLNTGSEGQRPVPKCMDIGHGFDSFVAAQQILDILGIEVQSRG